MSDELPILTAEFPIAVRGYAREAVDEFVQEIGERLNALQAELAKQAARGDRLAEDAGSMEAELKGFRDKEKAVSNAYIAAENFKAKAESDYEAAMEKARQEAEGIIASAQSEAEVLKAQAEGLVAKGKSDADEIRAKARADADEVKNTAKADADKARAQARSDADAMRAKAQSEAEEIVADSRQRADEMVNRARATVSDLELQIKSLKTEYVETLAFVRKAIEAQLDALPAADEVPDFKLPSFSSGAAA